MVRLTFWRTASETAWSRSKRTCPITNHQVPSTSSRKKPQIRARKRRARPGLGASAAGGAIAETIAAAYGGRRTKCNRHRDGDEMTAEAPAQVMMSGFGSHFATEAVPGALPQGRN